MDFISTGSYEDDFVQLVRLELNDIKNTFIKIGFRLLEADDNKYYEKLGFKDIIDCSESLFGFKKSTTYDLMRVSLLFRDSDNPMQLASSYQCFNQSQLVLFSQISMNSSEFIHRCDPNMPIADLKKAKKYWNSLMAGRSYVNGNYRACNDLYEFIELWESSNPVTPKSDIVLESGESGYLVQEALNMPEDPSIEQICNFFGKVVNKPVKNSGRPEKRKPLVAVDAYNLVKSKFDSIFKELGYTTKDGYYKWSERYAAEIVYILLKDNFVFKDRLK